MSQILPATGVYLKDSTTPLSHQIEAMIHKHKTLSARQLSNLLSNSPTRLAHDISTALTRMIKSDQRITRQKVIPSTGVSSLVGLWGTKEVWTYSLAPKAIITDTSKYVPYITRIRRNKQRVLLETKQRRIEIQRERLAKQGRRVEALAPQPESWSLISDALPDEHALIEKTLNQIGVSKQIRDDLRSELLIQLLENKISSNDLITIAKKVKTAIYRNSVFSVVGKSIYSPIFDDKDSPLVEAISHSIFKDSNINENWSGYNRDPESLLINKEEQEDNAINTYFDPLIHFNKLHNKN